MVAPAQRRRSSARTAGTHTAISARRFGRAPNGSEADDDDDDDDGAAAALRAWLTASLTAFNGRFHLAENRVFQGLEYESEGEWQGGYDFVQLADPQLGMLHRDRYWTEELTMLRLALQHVNRLVSVHISWLARVHMTHGSRAPALRRRLAQPGPHPHDPPPHEQ